MVIVSVLPITFPPCGQGGANRVYVLAESFILETLKGSHYDGWQQVLSQKNSGEQLLLARNLARRSGELYGSLGHGLHTSQQ